MSAPDGPRGAIARRRSRTIALALAPIVCCLIASAPSAALVLQPTTTSSSGFHSEQYAAGQVFQNVCSSIVAPGEARCLAFVRTDAGERSSVPTPPGVVEPSASNPAAGGAYSPAYLRSAYNAPSPTSASGETVAVVDAYDDPNAESDLASYRSYFGLPSCTTATGCFTKVNQSGESSPLPVADTSWSQEISLDLDMVSAICPSCRILLVEASSATIAALGSAVNEAVALGAVAVSNSYGAAEYSTETTDSTTYFDHPGVAITASAGDSGYGVEFPASSPLVTAVGGTSLSQLTASGTRDATESAWSGTGSGCSAYEPKPTFQSDVGCASRTVADVSAIADPNTGVWVYDSFGGGSWGVFGGTSVASPIVASFFALAGTAAVETFPNSYPYADPGGLNDITSGTNGSCQSSYLCTAGVGYDGPSGLGTPNGIAAFSPPPTPPGMPQNVVATPGDGKISLTWTAPTDYGTAPITGYDVYRSTTGGTKGVDIAPGVVATSFTDASATNGTTYYYEISAINSAGEGAPSVAVAAVAKRANVITVSSAAPSDAVFSGSPYQPTATATSGDAVVISSATTAVCRPLATGVDFVGVGTCTLGFDDPGDSIYAPAFEVSQSFPVHKAIQSPLSITSTTGTYGIALALSASGGSGGGAVAFNAVSDATASGCAVVAGALSSTSDGSCIVTATKASDADYSATSSLPTTVTLGVIQLAQTIGFTSTPPTGAVASGSNSQTYSVSAVGGGSNNAVSFHVDASSTSGCSIFDSMVAFGAAFGTCVIDADQQGSATYAPATEATQSFLVIQATQSPLSVTTRTGTAGVPLALETSGGSGTGGVTFVANDATATGCALVAGALITTGAGTCVVVATKAADALYSATSTLLTTITLGLAQLPQTIRFTSTPPTRSIAKGTNTQRYLVRATGGASINRVIFHIDHASMSRCSISGSVVSFGRASGSCVIDADQAGSATFEAAPEVAQSFQIRARPVASKKRVASTGPRASRRAHATASVALETTRLHLVAKESIALRLRCDGSTCKGTLSLSESALVVIHSGGTSHVVRRSIPLGSVRFLLLRNRTRLLHLTLVRSGKVLLEGVSASHPIRAVAHVAVTGGRSRSVGVELS